MVDLFVDRIEVVSFFINVGFDVFGFWTVRIRKIRGGVVNLKRWGVVFICLSSRVIYIEVIEFMDISSFICVLRRFFVFRGIVFFLRCDRGTNFIGVKAELDNVLIELD